MPALRQNFFTKEWVILGTERAKRPEELATHRVVQPIPEFVESCPLCPGNESKTPPEVLRYPANSDSQGGACDSEQVCGALERGAAHAQFAAPAAAH